MSSELPAGFTAFHSPKGWEVFLLPATQSTLSLDLLLPQLEQSPSPSLEPVLWSCVCQHLAVLPVSLRSVEEQGWLRVGPLQLLPQLVHSCPVKLVLLEAGISSLQGEKEP